MADTDSIRSRLEAERTFHVREAEHISKLLRSLDEAEQYLNKSINKDDAQRPLILTPPISAVPPRTNGARIRDALMRMPDTFTGRDVWIEANADGGAIIDKRKNFGPIFTDLIQSGWVVQVQPQRGNIAGIYMKGEQLLQNK